MRLSDYMESDGEPLTFVVPCTVRDTSINAEPLKTNVSIDFEPDVHEDGVALMVLRADAAQPSKGTARYISLRT